MVSFVTPPASDWKDHNQLMSAAAAHRRQIAKKALDKTDQLCADLAKATLEAPFLLDALPAPKSTELSQQSTETVRSVSIVKRLS